MPLIIETYFHPYTEISDLLFPGKQFNYIEKPISEPASEDQFYFTKEKFSREIKYYFNKIYYIENGRICCLHKTARQLKFYDLKSGKLIVFTAPIEPSVPQIDKTEFLPQLNAQNGEHVIFPEGDDDE